MSDFPPPPATFSEKKAKIISQLQLPPEEYTDLSPKGSVDEALIDVIDEVNAVEGFVTTSSCAGRASVFLEGSRVRPEAGSGEGGGGTVAGVGGKGGGGTWLYVSHAPFEETSAGTRDWEAVFGLNGEDAQERGTEDEEKRFIHFKFEPMILHVLTASLEHAQALLRCAQQAGFRESGVINVTSAAGESDVIPIVAIRTMGLGFESLIGFQFKGKRQSMVSTSYLETLVDLANTRFVENKKRIERFRSGFENLIANRKSGREKPEGWEDSEARRARKRAEGLRRREELKKAEQLQNIDGHPDGDEDTADLLTNLGL